MKHNSTAGVAIPLRAEPSDEELDELAMRVCGVLHGDVLHMDRKQRIAYARRVLALGVKVDGLTHLHVRTRHPQDYVLHNDQDGTRWRGTADGRWVRDDAGVALPAEPKEKNHD